MAKRKNPSKPKVNKWYKHFLQSLCIAAGYIPDASYSISELKSIIAVTRSQLGAEHSVPNQLSEILQFIMFAQGADENEVRQAVQETIPAKDMATVQGVSVETVKENRQQLREARKTSGIFSQEAREARADLREDRRASRISRRKNGMLSKIDLKSSFGRLFSR